MEFARVTINANWSGFKNRVGDTDYKKNGTLVRRNRITEDHVRR